MGRMRITGREMIKAFFSDPRSRAVDAFWNSKRGTRGEKKRIGSSFYEAAKGASRAN